MEAEASTKDTTTTATTTTTTSTARLRIAGAWSGVLEVDLDVWTVPMLREEVAKRSGCEEAPKSINMICGGKVLKDGEVNQKLSELGIRNSSKILASLVSIDQGNSLKETLMAEEDRSRELARLKAAAIALTKRHADGSLPVEDFNIELEDQSGQKVHMGSETDQRGLMMGLMLHANAKHLIKKQKYKDALDVLSMGEEAFSFCDPNVIKMIDNVSILQIDTVWCYFMLRDIKWLSMAGVRLAKARKGLEYSHGKDSARVRTLQAGRNPELALISSIMNRLSSKYNTSIPMWSKYLRLELLEGVVAYHSDQFEKSWKALTAAQVKYHQLQVTDESLSLLMSMGYKEREAKRALKMTSQDVERAVDFLVEEKQRKTKRKEEDILRRKDIMEQKRYGLTPLKKAVDLQRLNELVSIGFEKELIAEALRRNENDTQSALDDLTTPEKNSLLQLYIDSKKRKRMKQATEAIIEDLVSMGFERSKVVAAVSTTGTQEQALSLLIAEPVADTTIAANSSNIDSAIPVDNSVGSASLDHVEETGSSSGTYETQERDVEMEDALAQELTGDPFSDYDIEVTKEGDAITEYMALLASTSNT